MWRSCGIYVLAVASCAGVRARCRRSRRLAVAAIANSACSCCSVERSARLHPRPAQEPVAALCCFRGRHCRNCAVAALPLALLHSRLLTECSPRAMPCAGAAPRARASAAAHGRCWKKSHMDTLGIEPRASRMLSGCDTTTPRALDHVVPRCFGKLGNLAGPIRQWHTKSAGTVPLRS